MVDPNELICYLHMKFFTDNIVPIWEFQQWPRILALPQPTFGHTGERYSRGSWPIFFRILLLWRSNPTMQLLHKSGQHWIEPVCLADGMLVQDGGLPVLMGPIVVGNTEERRHRYLASPRFWPFAQSDGEYLFNQSLKVLKIAEFGRHEREWQHLKDPIL
jgi:hypothetical protein